jgi:hypothetical protein
LSGDCVTNLSEKVENENEDKEMEMDVEGETSKEVQSISPAPGAKCGQGHSYADMNISMCYILFVGFTMQDKQFLSWGDIDAVSCRTIYNKMALCFKELQY